MVSYDLPIKISRARGGYSIAVALSDQVVVSRQVSRADLMQLQVILAEVLDERRPPGAAPAPQAAAQPLSRQPAADGDDFLFDIDS